MNAGRAKCVRMTRVVAVRCFGAGALAMARHLAKVAALTAKDPAEELRRPQRCGHGSKQRVALHENASPFPGPQGPMQWRFSSGVQCRRRPTSFPLNTGDARRRPKSLIALNCGGNRPAADTLPCESWRLAEKLRRHT